MSSSSTASTGRWELVNDDPRPFVTRNLAAVIVPEPEDPDSRNVGGFCTLIRREQTELEVELGCPVVFVTEVPSDAAIPLVLIDRRNHVVILDGPEIWDVATAFQLLGTAVRTGQADTFPEEPRSTQVTIKLIEREVGLTYPAFSLRGIDWPTTMNQHKERLIASDAAVASIQHLLADLQDAHTWVRKPGMSSRLPYRVWASKESAHLAHVPKWSPGWAAEARAGDEVISNRIGHWWERTSATPRTRPLVTGYRMLSGRMGGVRHMRVVSHSGETISWREQFPALPGSDHCHGKSAHPEPGISGSGGGWRAASGLRPWIRQCANSVQPHVCLSISAATSAAV